MSQSKRDARDGEIPVVMHRKNNSEWLVTLQFESFMEMYAESGLVEKGAGAVW